MNSRGHQIKPSHENTHSWILSEDSEEIEPKALAKYKNRPKNAHMREHIAGLLRDRAVKCREARSRLTTWLRSGNEVFHISVRVSPPRPPFLSLLLTISEGKSWLWEVDPDENAGQSPANPARIGAVGWKQQPHRLPLLFLAIRRRAAKLADWTLSIDPLRSSQRMPRVDSSRISCSTYSQSQDNCIEEAFFEPEDIQRAFDRLLSGSLPLGYHFCFFIDGLDEYGEDGIRDRLEHEKLAKSLSEWSKRNSIKIVATSRPYVEFQLAFSPDRRIHLHDLAWFDIFNFAHHTLEGHRDFRRIEEDSDELSARVANDSNGVFLWAAVTVRSVYSSITNHLDMPDLYQQLEDTPKELNQLYHSLLGLLSPRDRLRASKMLLMTYAIARHNKVLDPCVLSWVEEWDDPSFPLNKKPGPRTAEQYFRQVEKVAAQVDGITNGLLEVGTNRNDRGYCGSSIGRISRSEERPFIQFYHRTIRDFVITDTEMIATLAKHPAFDADRTFARVLISAIWFSQPPFDFQSELIDLRRSMRALPADTFSSFKTVWQLGSSKTSFTHFHHNINASVGWTVNAPPSFNHWAVSAWADLPDSELDRVIQDQRSDPNQENWSLLFSAASGAKPRLVEKLLLRGCSPNEGIETRSWNALGTGSHRDSKEIGPHQTGEGATITMWMAFCVQLFAHFETWRFAREERPFASHILFQQVHFQILELLLEAGANPDIHYEAVMGFREKEPSAWRRDDISLRQLVVWRAPENLDRLMTLMGISSTDSASFPELSELCDIPVEGIDLYNQHPDGFEVFERRVICGDEGIEFGAPFTGKYSLLLPLW